MPKSDDEQDQQPTQGAESEGYEHLFQHQRQLPGPVPVPPQTQPNEQSLELRQTPKQGPWQAAGWDVASREMANSKARKRMRMGASVPAMG